MDFTNDLEALNGALDFLEEHWSKQNNQYDGRTRFIYQYDSFTELMQSNEMQQLSDDIKQYLLHRWYNRMTSEVCEKIFANYGARAATENENIEDGTDIFIADTPFDVKVSVFPSNREVRGMNLDLRKQKDKDRLIKWFYENQSREQRADGDKEYSNRIFVVCEGSDYRENLELKQDYEQMELKIKLFMSFLKRNNYDFNTVNINGNEVKAEIITLKYYPEGFMTMINSLCPNCGSEMNPIVAKNDYYRGNFIRGCTSCDTYLDM